MFNEVTSSIQSECNQRLEQFYKTCNTWLLQVSYNITKSKLDAEELVSDLYLYLHEKCNPKIFYADSYNKMYAMSFLKHRWLNKVNKLKRTQYIGEVYCDNEASEEYDTQRDLDIMETYESIKKEVDKLKKTKNFASAMIFEKYWYSDNTLNEVAEKIGISKSTTFIHIKKVRAHMKEILNNPFND